MKITIESTTQITKVNGVPARVWEGVTANGVKVHALITRIAVKDDPGTDFAEFERDLQEHAAPCSDAGLCFPSSMIL